MLVSILMPTRCRFPRLIETIDSIYNTAKLGDFEILLRIDDDDEDTINNLYLLRKYEKVSFIVIGKRYRGYVSMATFYEELILHAKGQWFFFFDDDTVLIQVEKDKESWDKQLAKFPTHGKIAHPEFYWLGGSKYPSGFCHPVGICVPNKSWVQYSKEYVDPITGQSQHIEQPVDRWLEAVLRDQNGWEDQWLLGTAAHHRRDDKETLTKHRKLNVSLKHI